MPRHIRMTTVNVTEAIRRTFTTDSPERLNAEMQLAGLHAALTDTARKRTEKERVAAEAGAEAQIAIGEEQLAAVKLLRFAARFSHAIAVEKNWLLPFQNENGDVILENPMTTRDQRVAARQFHSQLHQNAIESGNEDSGANDEDMFGHPEGE